MENKSSSSLVWGAVLLGFGLFLLAKTMGWVNIAWGEIIHFWPLLIVAAGVSMLFRKSWSGAMAAVLIAMAIPAGIINAGRNTISEIKENVENDINISLDDDDDNNSNNDSDDDSDFGGSSNNFSEALPANLKRASLDFEAGAGKFIIEGTSDQLIEAKTISELGGYKLVHQRNEAAQSSALQFKMSGKDSIQINSMGDWEKVKNKAEISLSSQPLWTINAQMGAGKGKLDLSEYRVEKIKLETGVSDVDLKLGDRTDLTEVNIESGVASIDIEVPENVGCEFVSKSALTIEKFDDFDKIDSKTHRTPNYNTASKKIKIVYEGGLSRVKVKRY